VVDILPTIASAAGIQTGEIDGIDHWNVLVNDESPKRFEVVSDLDNYDGYTGLIVNEWKLVNGTVRDFNRSFDGFLGEVEEFSTPENYTRLILDSLVGKSASNYTKELTASTIESLRRQATVQCNADLNPIKNCNLMKKPCLFNIAFDPCERKNLADDRPDVLQKMLKRLKELEALAVPSRRTFESDPLCDPGD
jgi:hypothetical protein